MKTGSLISRLFCTIIKYNSPKLFAQIEDSYERVGIYYVKVRGLPQYFLNIFRLLGACINGMFTDCHSSYLRQRPSNQRERI